MAPRSRRRRAQGGDGAGADMVEDQISRQAEAIDAVSEGNKGKVAARRRGRGAGFSPGWAPLACGLLALALHLNTLSTNEFIWDDRAAILMNEDVRPSTPLSSLLVHDFWGQSISLPDSHKSYRPLAVLSFRLNFLLHGLEPWGYHAANLALHAGVTGLFVLLVGTLSDGRSDGRALAWLSGLLFAVHPIHTEPVASLVGRADLLCAFFALAALLLFLSAAQHSSTGRLAAAFLLGFAASFSKEVGVTVFGLFVAHELIEALLLGCSVAGPSPWTALRAMVEYVAQHPSVAARVALSTAAVAGVFFAHTSLHGDQLLYQWTELENDIALLPSLQARVLSYGYVHVRYLLKLAWPFDLCYDHGFSCIPRVESIWDQNNLLTLWLYASLAAVVVYAIASKHKLLLWALALLIVPFVPASHVAFPVGTVLGERLLYLPSSGFVLASALLLVDGLLLLTDQIQALTSKLKGPKSGGSKVKLRGGAIVSTVVLVLMLGVHARHSVHRSADWTSELRLFESALQVCPRSLKVLNNLALRLLTESPESTRRASLILDEALSISPNFTSALFNKGLAHHNLHEYRESIHYFNQTAEVNPGNLKAKASMGRAFMLLGREYMVQGDSLSGSALLERATQIIEETMARGFNAPFVFAARATIAFEQEDWSTAVSYYRQTEAANAQRRQQGGGAADVYPEGEVFNMLGSSLRKVGDKAAALQVFNQGIEVAPTSFEIWANAAALYTDTGELDKALAYYSKALAIQPNSPELVNNIGWLYEVQGKLQDAAASYERALELLKPHSHPQIERNLANMLRRLRQDGE